VVKYDRSSREQHVDTELTLFQSFYVLSRWIIPILYSQSHIGRVIVTNVLVEFVFSWTTAIIFQANHVVDQVVWPKVIDGVVQGDWAELQVMATQDYSHGSWLAGLLSGGLNYQAVHHLFPHVSSYISRHI
jgi:fatty acid desaturase